MLPAINNNDIDTYIALFTSNNRAEMNAYIEQNTELQFFRESGLSLKEYVELSDETGRLASNISQEELAQYAEFKYIYFRMEMTESSSYNFNSNDSGYRIAVLVKENDEWKILRVSTPDVSTIIEQKQGFNTTSEIIAANEQEQAMQIVNKQCIQNGIMLRTMRM